MTDWLSKLYYREVPLGPSFVTIGVVVAIAIIAVNGLVREGYISNQYSVNLPDFVRHLPGQSQNDEFQYGSYTALSNAKYFDDARKAFIDAKTSFIEADLTSMKLQVYDKGVQVLEVPILTKGKPGSWWETPAGIYKIETKEENHFSSFGKVYQPWSMVFQGNFFIHGWPYHTDGTPVASTFSGGCVRLNTDDAKKVFDLVNVGMPVLVFETAFTGGDSIYALRPPQVTARQYLVADLKNNFVFSEKGKDEIVPIASVTKFVTALTAAEYINLDKTITFVKEMRATTSIPRLEVGEEYSAYALLYPLLQESSNEAAVALERFLPTGALVGAMNKKAQAIGMSHTHFVDSFGGSSGNASSAEDLFQLAKFLNNNRSFVLKLSANTLKTNSYDAPDFTDLQNFNIFAGEPNFIGGKIGKNTAAAETMLALFNLPQNGMDHPIAIIVLGSQNVEADVRALYDFAKNNFSLVI